MHTQKSTGIDRGDYTKRYRKTDCSKHDAEDFKGVSEWKRGHIFFIRCVSIVLAVIFLHQQTGWAQGGRPVWAQAKAMEVVAKNNIEKSAFEIPYDLASTDKVKINGGDEVIIQVQDAHASLSAQYSIVNLLDSLVTNYDLDFIALEGAQGYIDTSILRSFPDKDIRKSTADFLMREGRMSAGEFFAITTDADKVSLYGIEDDALYQENIKSFRGIAENRAKQSGNLTNLINQLDLLSTKICSEELKSLNESCRLHREGKKSFSDHWKELGKCAGKYNISLGEYAELSRLIESIELEESIDFEKANTERRQLIDALSSVMEKPELEALVLKSLAYKQNKVSQGNYHRDLIALAESKEIEADGYENMIRFTRYVTIYEAVDLFNLYREIDDVEGKIRDKVYSSKEEKELYEMTAMAGLLKQLYTMELTNVEFRRLMESYKTFSAAEYAKQIKGKCSKYDVVIVGGYDLAEVEDGIPGAMKFYYDAHARDRAMFLNTFRRMRKEGKHVGALITGGFHTEGLTDLMQRNGLSYLVVTPKFESEKERPYIAILTNKKRPYEKLLEGGEYKLAVAPYFYNYDLASIKPAIFYALGAAKLNRLRDVRVDWVSAYEVAYNSFISSGEEDIEGNVISPKEFSAFLERVNVVKGTKRGTVVITEKDDTGNVLFITLSPVDGDALSLDVATAADRKVAQKRLTKEDDFIAAMEVEITALQESDEALKKELESLKDIIGEALAGKTDSNKDMLERIGFNDKKITGHYDRRFKERVTFVINGEDLTKQNVRETLRQIEIENVKGLIAYLRRVAGDNGFRPSDITTMGSGGKGIADICEEELGRIDETNIEGAIQILLKEAGIQSKTDIAIILKSLREGWHTAINLPQGWEEDEKINGAMEEFIAEVNEDNRVRLVRMFILTVEHFFNNPPLGNIIVSLGDINGEKIRTLFKDERFIKQMDRLSVMSDGEVYEEPVDTIIRGFDLSGKETKQMSLSQDNSALLGRLANKEYVVLARLREVVLQLVDLAAMEGEKKPPKKQITGIVRKYFVGDGSSYAQYLDGLRRVKEANRLQAMEKIYTSNVDGFMKALDAAEKEIQTLTPMEPGEPGSGTSVVAEEKPAKKPAETEKPSALKRVKTAISDRGDTLREAGRWISALGLVGLFAAGGYMMFGEVGLFAVFGLLGLTSFAIFLSERIEFKPREADPSRRGFLFGAAKAAVVVATASVLPTLLASCGIQYPDEDYAPVPTLPGWEFYRENGQFTYPMRYTSKENGTIVEYKNGEGARYEEGMNEVTPGRIITYYNNGLKIDEDGEVVGETEKSYVTYEWNDTDNTVDVSTYNIEYPLTQEGNRNTWMVDESKIVKEHKCLEQKFYYRGNVDDIDATVAEATKDGGRVRANGWRLARTRVYKEKEGEEPAEGEEDERYYESNANLGYFFLEQNYYDDAHNMMQKAENYGMKDGVVNPVPLRTMYFLNEPREKNGVLEDSARLYRLDKHYSFRYTIIIDEETGETRELEAGGVSELMVYHDNEGDISGTDPSNDRVAVKIRRNMEFFYGEGEGSESNPAYEASVDFTTSDGADGYTPDLDTFRQKITFYNNETNRMRSKRVHEAENNAIFFLYRDNDDFTSNVDDIQVGLVPDEWNSTRESWWGAPTPETVEYGQMYAYQLATPDFLEDPIHEGAGV